ncbi:uroporphyrinogen III methylase, partial [Candidatus Collierbacteria bacterium CG10_big_fil_rev_8_21_14_0_10_44_9]
MQNTSLTVVGVGIKVISHITVEAKAYIEQSDKVLYLVNTPVIKEWIKKYSKNSESLDELYQKYPLRLHCYRAITEYVLEETRKGQHICMVIYGHPTIFAQSGVDAVIQAKKEGIDARILPGISAGDCLFADLMIDPGRYGCQSFEATDLLIHHRQWDPTSYLLIWQVGIIGVLGRATDDFDNSRGAQLLQDRLLKHYNADHKVTLYEAAQYPQFKPKIVEFELSKLV